MGRATSRTVSRTNVRSFAGALLAVLVALTATACGDDRAERFGEGWNREGSREALSFFVAAAAHGNPPGWAQWEAEHEPSGPEGELYGRRFQPYVAEAKSSHRDSPASDFWERTLRLTDRQRTAVRPDGQEEAEENSSVAAHFEAWLDDNAERLETVEPRDVVPLYVRDLEAAADSVARGHLADVESLLREAARLGPPTPDPTGTFAPDAPPADVTDQ